MPREPPYGSTEGALKVYNVIPTAKSLGVEPPYGSTEGALKDTDDVPEGKALRIEPPYGSTEGALKEVHRFMLDRLDVRNHHTALQREH